MNSNPSADAHRNPFRVSRIHGLPYRAEGTSVAGLWGELESLGRRAWIVGPRGHGKTTLMLALADHARTRGHRVLELRLSLEEPTFRPETWASLLAPPDRGPWLFIDGFDHLRLRDRIRLAPAIRASRGFLGTLHRWRPWDPVLRRWPLLHRCRTSPELLDRLVRELDPGPHASLRPNLEELYRRHRGNVREALFELYDRAGEPTVPREHSPESPRGSHEHNTRSLSNSIGR